MIPKTNFWLNLHTLHWQNMGSKGLTKLEICWGLIKFNYLDAAGSFIPRFRLLISVGVKNIQIM
jgi:hypothetical protein